MSNIYILIAIGCVISFLSIKITLHYLQKYAKKNSIEISEKSIFLIENGSIIYLIYKFFSSSGIIGDYFSFPLFFIDFVPIIISIHLYNEIFKPIWLLNSKNSNQNTINTIVRRVIRSDEFYTAITTSLPKGEYDKRYGLDYIPFMLEELKHKKDRFRRSSNNFLIATISLSIFFTLIVISFSYILLSEDIIGIKKELNDLNSLNKNLELKYDSFSLSDKENTNFIQICNSQLNDLESYSEPVSSKVKSLQDTTSTTIYRFKANGNAENLYYSLNSILNSFIINNKITLNKYDKTYITDFKELLLSIDKYNKIKKNIISNNQSTNTQIANTIKTISEKLKVINFDQSDLIRRLIISIVVVTFCIAILRYFRQLYSSHYNEMLRAEEQDLLIRKFYVTFKSSVSDDNEVKKAVLSSFLSNTITMPNDMSNNSSDNKINDETLKEILSAMLKKI